MDFTRIAIIMLHILLRTVFEGFSIGARGMHEKKQIFAKLIHATYHSYSTIQFCWALYGIFSYEWGQSQSQQTGTPTKQKVVQKSNKNCFYRKLKGLFTVVVDFVLSVCLLLFVQVSGWFIFEWRIKFSKLYYIFYSCLCFCFIFCYLLIGFGNDFFTCNNIFQGL